MSKQKLKILKKIKGIDSYSKNPIIDSLINQKLQSEIIIIKDNFNQFVRKEDFKSKELNIQPRPNIKRRLSSHNLGTLTPQKIKASINFNPINQFTLEFVNQRQKQSPIIQQSAIIELNKARSTNEDLLVKLKSSDKIIYQSPSSQDPNLFYTQLENKLKKTIPSDIWLPQKPEVQQIIKNKFQNSALSSKRQKSQLYPYTTADKQYIQGLSPLKNSRDLTNKKGNKANLQPEINYQIKKYHKDDFISLQKWLETSLSALKNEQKKLQQDQQTRQKECLNRTFTIYVCAIKQLIRLTYIQSAQKGLFLQKLIWSLVRLFQHLIQQQHSINYNDFKNLSKDRVQERQLFKNRMEKLQNKLKQTQKLVSKLSEDNKKIAYTALTFKKVNQQMNTEIECLVQKIELIQKQNKYLMNNLITIIKQFEERQIIKVQKTEDFITYFYLNSKNKIEVVAQVQRKDQLGQNFKNEMNNLQTLTPKSIERLENQLINYWGKKRSYLDVDTIVKQLCYSEIKDAEIQADGKGPSFYEDMSTQHPLQGQQTFQQFLSKQLSVQRQIWTRKQQQYKQTQITLKDLYSQLRDTITNLTSHNAKLKSNIDQKDHEFTIAQRKIMQVEQKNTLLLKKIVQLQNLMDQMQVKQNQYKVQIQEGMAKTVQMKKKYMFGVENNKILASNIFNLSQKVQVYQKKFEDLQNKIKILAPQLQQTMNLAIMTQNPILLTLNSLIQLHLSNYVERDAKVFLTF